MNINLLKNLVRINSIFPSEQKMGAFLMQHLKLQGFVTMQQQIDGSRINVLAEKGKGKHSLLLFGHLDTVPLTDKSAWKTNPFSLIQKSDRLYGLGAWDMKGGIAALLSAVDGITPRGYKLKIAFVVDEENYSLGMHTLIQSGWLRDVKGALSPEPGFTYGLKGIALGRIGRSVYKVVVQTDGGHVYKLESSHNAISESFKVLDVLKKLKRVSHPKLGDFMWFPRYIRGGVSAMSVPDRVELEIEAQLVPPQTTQSVLRDMRQLISTSDIDASVTISPVERPTPFCQPYAVDKAGSFVKHVEKVLQRVVEEKPVFYYRRSVADENRVAALGIPVLTVGPEGGNAHQPNEWVSAQSLTKLTEFIKRLLVTYNTNN